MKMGDIALRYLDRGFAVVPAQGKRPLVNWRKYQEVRPSQDEVVFWWGRFPNANIALVTGAVSGVVVVDVDGETAEKFTPTAYCEELARPLSLLLRPSGRHRPLLRRCAGAGDRR